MKIHTKVNENTYTKKVDENKYTKKVDENTYTTKVGENTYPTKVDENTNTSRQPGYIRCGTEGKATPLASGLKPCPLLFLLAPTGALIVMMVYYISGGNFFRF